MNATVPASGRKSTRWLGALALAFLAMLPLSQAVAQTASDLNGIVSTEAGSPVSGASVTITHEPSGTRRTATSGASGGFFQSGLRVGGPYTIRITAEGYRNAEFEQIYLSAGSQEPLRVTLQPVSEGMEEIIVTGQATVMRDLNSGVGSSFTAEDINNTPATQRDVIRTLLRDPLAQSNGDTGNLSVAGVNPRFNGLAIDGSLQQDDFGLGSSTYATARSPINLDAIESATLVASDYDVTSSGFTGGLVNLTTKSGTNEWDGSVFYYAQTDSMIGDTYDGDRTFAPGDIDEKEYGFTLRGPIVRDKLFFAFSYDEFESADTNDFTNEDANDGRLPGFFDGLRQEIINSTGYDPGTRPDTANTPVTSERMLAKFDWNITDLHRASLTYQKTEETGSSVDADNFESAWYDIPVDLESYTIQVFSDWNDKLSTTLRINNKEFTRGQNCRAGLGVGQVEIDGFDEADVIGSNLEGLVDGFAPETVGGCDRFRHANEFTDERLQVMAKADYFIGDHVVTAGVEYEDFSLFNLFVQSSRGRFTFGDFTELQTNTGVSVSYQNALSNVASDGAAAWGYDRWTFFVQDVWQITPDFELGFGLRYETFSQSESPAFNQRVFDDLGIRTDENLDGRDLILPRISFRWDAADRTTITGGLGMFSGGDPKVWTSNAFQPAVVFTSGTFDNVDPTVIPQQLLDNVAAGTPLPIDAISPDFEIPSDLKASIRVEQGFDLKLGSLDLGDDYVFMAQYLYTQTEDGFLWQNVPQIDGTYPTGVAPDGRVIYADLQDIAQSAADPDLLPVQGQNLTLLGNHDEGKSHVFTLALGKRYESGFDFNFSYAFQDAQVVTEGTSSRGISNWRGITDVDRNFPGAKVSPFQIEHSFKLNLGYETYWNTDGWRTRFDLFARRFSGDTYYNTFNTSSSNSLFGRASQFESPFDNNPLYIPTGPSDPLVVYDSGFDQTGFFEYVSANGFKSGIQAPFGESAGWTSIWDLRIQQDIKGLPFLGDTLGDNNFQIVLDIDNFLNLLNDDWGVVTNGPGFGQNAIVTADLVTAADVAANGVDAATALTGDSMRTACQSASDCVYRFNSFSDRSINNVSASRSVYRIRLGFRFDF